ncbi:hypothetical protein B0H13DRAFT_1594743, partial [Mycena leptocephala]
NGNTTKSEAQINSLAHNVIRHPDFKIEELAKFDAGRANKQVDVDAQVAFPLLAKFKEVKVNIEVPSGSLTKVSPCRKSLEVFDVPGLYYGSLVSVIKSAFADLLSRHFHFSPFKVFQKIRSIFSEIYNFDAFIAEHDRVQPHRKLPPDDLRGKREKSIAALMFWSDSTHLANFGTAKLWSIYMLFGNLSKYIHSKPNAGAEHHVAYIPSVSLVIIHTVLVCLYPLQIARCYSRQDHQVS